MDFGKLLSDVEALQAQFDTASKQQEDTMRKLESELEKHYSGLQQGVGALKTGLDQNVSELKTDLEEKIQQNTADQTAAMEAVRKSQVDFAQSHSDHMTSLEQKQGELRASIDSALQASQSAASQAAEQEKKIAALNQAVEQSVRGFQQQLAGTREAAQAQASELRAAMEKMDPTKPFGEMQKRLDLMQTETTRMLNSLGGQVESMKTQLEQAKEGQRSLNRIREELEHATKRMDKLEQSLREQGKALQDRANQRVVTMDGTIVPAPYHKEKKSLLPLLAIGLSALAILGMILGGILLKMGQDKLTNQIEQQLLPPQGTMAAQLDDLSKQVKNLTVLAQATPEPTPAPTPTPTPVPTEAPTATSDAEATPK
jgi:chromosome segregation ATPase